MSPNTRRSVTVACGEAVVDEFAHLEPDHAGEVLAYALRWHALTLEREKGDAAVLAYYAGIRRDLDAAEAKFKTYLVPA